MKRIFCLLIAFHTLNNFVMHAQSLLETNNLYITSSECQRQGDSISITFHIESPKLSIKTQNSIDLQPYITNGSDTVNLSILSLKGNNSFKVYQRATALMSKEKKIT